MKLSVTLLLVLAAAMKAKVNAVAPPPPSPAEECTCTGTESSMSVSTSKEVSIGGPNGHYECNTSVSVSRSVGPGHSSMSASASRDVSLNQCGNHVVTHDSKSISRSEGNGHCSMSASETHDLSVTNVEGHRSVHTSASVSKSVGNGRCSMSTSVTEDVSINNAAGHLQTHHSRSVSRSVGKGYCSMSASETNDVSMTTAGGRLRAHKSTSVSCSVSKGHQSLSSSLTQDVSVNGPGGHKMTHLSTSVSRSVGKGYLSSSVSMSKDEYTSGPCGQRRAHKSMSISQSIDQNHRSLSASMSQSESVHNGNCYRRASTSTSISESVDATHESLSRSQSTSVYVQGPCGYHHARTSQSLSRTIDKANGRYSVSTSTTKDVSFAGRYGHGHFHKSVSSSKTKGQGYEHGSKSVSASYSASGVRNGKHWSVSTSVGLQASYGYGKGYQQHHHGSHSHEHKKRRNLFYPKCCNPCDILKNPESDFYKRCGQFLGSSFLSAKYAKCVSIKKNKAELEAFLDGLKNVCYTRFITLVNFDCPAVEFPSFKWGTNDKKNLEKLKDTCAAEDYCPPEEKQCDRCEALVNENSQFYKVCGYAIDESLRQLWFMKCRYSVGHCHWNIILSMIIGYCHSINPSVIPDFCVIEEPTTTTTTTTTTTPSPNCAYDGGMLQFGSVDVLIKGCTLICNCTTPGIIECRPASCDANAFCNTNEVGNQICTCKEPFEGDGFTCLPPPLPACRGQKIDLVFVVDTSQSISTVDFEKMKKFVKGVISDTDIGVDRTLVGIIRFSSVATLETYLGEITDKAKLLAKAETILHDMLLTYTDRAIREADKMLTQYGRQGDTKAVVIIVTDGKSTDQIATILAMKQFRENHPNATVMAIGVTNSGDVDVSELRMLASGVEKKYIATVANFDELLKGVQVVANESCKANQQPSTEGCEEVLYYCPSTPNRWFSHYGVYVKYTRMGLCNGENLYVHTNYRSYLQWDGSTWVISQKPCRFDNNVQTLAKLIYAPGTPPEDHHYISNPGDIWIEPADAPEFNNTVTVCF